MKLMQSLKSKTGIAVLMAILVVSLAGAAFAADDDYTSVDVQVTVNSVSAGTQQVTAAAGVTDEDDVLYLPVDVLLSLVGADYAVRDGSLYFPVGNTVASVDTVDVAGMTYAPVLDTLHALGVNRGLANNQLTIELW